MSIKRILLLALFLFSVSLFAPKTSQAIDLKEILTSEDSIVVKIQEGIEYFFAFRVENKVAVLERHAEKRLVMAQGYAEQGNNERVQNLLQNYLQIKERQNNLLGRTDDGEVLGLVEERTIEQQKIMEKIKNIIIDDNGKQGVIDVQEQVVNQVAQRIVVQNGTEGQMEFLNEVLHVWAPGTGPGGGAAGVVIEGGEMRFAPGTSEGGPSGSDIKTQEVKTGGVSNDVPVNNSSGGNWAPGTTQGGTSGDTIDAGDGGGLAPGTTLEGKNELAP